LIQAISLLHEQSMFQSNTTPPSFAWWYVDALDHQGTGCVCIFSQGLPFLPETDADRSERFSVNCVIYNQGKEVFYLLQEFDSSEVVQDRVLADDTNTVVEVWTIGSHRFQRSIDQQGTVTCAIDLVSSHQRTDGHFVTGRIEFEGQLVDSIPTVGHHAHVDSPHQWTPVTTQCMASVDLETSVQNYRFTGTAYHDSNISTEPLHRLGISHWWWARASFLDTTWIVYLVYPKNQQNPVWMVASVKPNGSWQFHTVASVENEGVRRSIYGLSLPARWNLYLTNGDCLRLDIQGWLDDSPFYQRVLVQLQYQQTQQPVQQGLGYLEHVVPTKLNVPWQQPFIRMKTHFAGRPGSFFSPLFTGSSTTRWSRQLSQCLPL